MTFDELKKIIRLGVEPEEFERIYDIQDRRLYLYGLISSLDDIESNGFRLSSTTGKIVEAIFKFNRDDANIPVEDRRPIRLYINSPGGDIGEGFALVDAIKLSKTPIYTINVGEWSSMSFLIGITGHKRFSLPSATFLLHDGSSGAYGSTNKVQDRIKFEERFEKEVIKKHVLDRSKMTEKQYDNLLRIEYYMLPEDALKHGFIDEIVADIDSIL